MIKRSSKIKHSSPSYQPDPDQAAYLNQKTASYSFVVAGPGSGKTTTAVHKILRIEDERKGGETRAVLFISFSRASIRAAAGTMYEKLEALDLEFQAQTIDSLAYETCQLYSGEDASSIRSLSFKSRLELARQLAKEWRHELTDDLIHVFIDEAQDISPDQSRFLESYLKYLPADCGVTVFADPLQEIYRFLDAEIGLDANPDGSETSRFSRFIGMIKNLGTWKHFEFSGQYRCTTPLARRQFNELSTVRSLDKFDDQVKFLDSFQGALPRVNILRLAEISRRTNSTAAVLTRTNASVGFLFDRLVRSGMTNLQPVLAREYRNALPDWLAEAFKLFGPGEVNSHRLRDFLENRHHPDHSAFRGVSGDLSWEEVSARIGSYDRALPSSRPGQLNLQTIHQAKGLEFDHVAILNPAELLQSDVPELELLYVALTRSREICYSLEPDPTLEEFRSNRGRLYRYVYRKGKPRLESIMILPTDIAVPPTLPGVPISEISKATFLEFEPISFRDHPSYRCSVNGISVAETTPEFGKLLQRQFGSRLPERIGSVPIASLNTEFRSDDHKMNAVLVPKPFGIADLR